MALYSFKHKESGQVTLVEARSKERAAQIIAAQTHEIGDDTVSGSESARLMRDGATFLDEASAGDAPDASGSEAQD